MTPPPTITRCFGISFNDKASVEVRTLFLSKLIKGRDAGLDPVAMTHLSKLIFSPVSLIIIDDESIKDPNPLKTVILFLSIKKFIPFTV